ncbi:tripartite tricarboxylate transporter substrate-binding protein [Litchfieldia salsa]|nr:tripartite tricarboxylate transporter substrate-binding protein [Litchfieldia salsa]
MKRKLMSLLSVTMLALSLVACGSSTSGDGDSATEVDVNRVRVVIGSTSTGGDTYQNADAISRFLEEPLGTNMKVDAVGANRAFDELASAKNDGSTVLFFHDMAYLSVEYGTLDEKYSLENWTAGPIVAINPGNAFLAKSDAPYNTMAESAEWLKDNPSESITVAIEAGGVSEIIFDGYYLWVKEEYGTEVSDRIKVYVTGSQSDKDQALWDGNADIIHGAIASNVQYTEDGVEDQIKMKFLGVTSAERVEGYDIPTFAEQGIKVNGKEFTFAKEYFFLLPKDIDEDFLNKLDKAAAEVAKDAKYAEDLEVNSYYVNYIPAAEAKEYLIEKKNTMKSIIENAPKLDDITSN